MPPRVVRPASGAPPRPRDLRPGFEAQTCETRHPMVLRPKPPNRPPMVLRPKPPNRPASSAPRTRPPPTRVTAVLDRPDAKSPEPPARLARPSSRLGQHGHSTSSCARRCTKCQPPRLTARRSGPSAQASRPPFTAPGPSARHVLLGLHLAVATVSVLDTCTHHKPRETSLDTPQCASHT
jgi:hypothetical protein